MSESENKPSEAVLSPNTPSPELPTAGEQIRQTLMALEKKIKWVKCAWCPEEAARLMPSCGLCIDCGRDARGFRHALHRMPTKTKVSLKIGVTEYGYRFPEELRTANMYTATMKSDKREAIVMVDTNREWPVMVTPDGLETRSFRDVFYAWKELQGYFDEGNWRGPHKPGDEGPEL
jgi:hypothetical protein